MQQYVELQSLIAVVTLSQELSFTRAAKRIDITQSGLSRNIKTIEHRHQIKLFERDHARVTLTDSGRAFVEQAKLSLLHNERAIQAARKVSEGVEEVLTIGCSPFVDPFLTTALHSIRLPMYPKLDLHFESDFAPELVHALLVEKLDMALITNPDINRKLTILEVAKAPMYAVLPENSPLLSQETVTLRDLASYQWILFEKKAHPTMHDTIFRRAGEEGLVVKDGQKFLSAEAAAQLVAEGLGVAFVSMPGALKIQHNGAQVRPIDDDALTLRVFLASRAENRSKLVSEFFRAFGRRISQVKKPPQGVKQSDIDTGKLRIVGT